MLKEHYVSPSDGFGRIMEKIKETLSLLGDSGKTETSIKYIKCNKSKFMFMMEPQKVQYELLPYFEQQLQDMK